MDDLILPRRKFLVGLGAAVATTLAAPAVIRTAGLLMPVRKVPKPTYRDDPLLLQLLILSRMAAHRIANPPMLVEWTNGNGDQPTFKPMSTDADVAQLRYIERQIELLKSA